jgi:superfamily II DNA or RNA helicase
MACAPLPRAMLAAIAALRPGNVVRIRDERWRILSHAERGDTAIVEAVGCDAGNRTIRGRFLLPFERIEALPVPRPRVVRPSRWRRAARRELSCATPAWTCLRAAADADLTIVPYQLEPALAVVNGEGCRFLLADAVGLGKTVQTGLIIAELLARGRDARALVVAPASLRDQWRSELNTRFRLDAEALDAGAVAHRAAELPSQINPWSLPRIVVTSIDYIKRPEVMRSIEMLTWDVVAFDEAHNLAGRSDRATAAQLIARRSRVVILVTATPHSGDEGAFQTLCGTGDVRDRYPLVMFRRTRADAGLAGRRRTRVRRVKPTDAEAMMHAALMTYASRAWREASGDDARGARLAMTVLSRRGCSSAGALARSVERRLALLQDATTRQAQLFLPFAEAGAEDDEPGGWLGSPGLRDRREERVMLEHLLGLAQTAAGSESKLMWLQRFLARSGEPAIVFTEYRDTLASVAAALAGISAGQLHGGLTWRERSEVLARFTSGGLRLLLATDAASEGLNLHHRCRLVINLELPWTPVRLDQRVGRVDRIGQQRTVHALHLVAAGTCEESIVMRLACRSDQIRDALGPPVSETMVAESVLGGARLRTAPPMSESPHKRRVISVDLRLCAAQEAERLAQVKAWLPAAADQEDSRPAMTQLRSRHRIWHQRLWAFRVLCITAADEILWETLLTVAADDRRVNQRSAAATRLALSYGHDEAALATTGSSRLLLLLNETLRRPLALSLQREQDVIDALRHDHARMASALLQAGLFDRRASRAAASQAATLEAALSQCVTRLENLRAWSALRAECEALAFGVILR